MYENELQHYGVKGMKWGKRAVNTIGKSTMNANKRLKRSVEQGNVNLARNQAASTFGVTRKRRDATLDKRKNAYDKAASKTKSTRKKKKYQRYSEAYDREKKVSKEARNHRTGVQKIDGKTTYVGKSVRRYAAQRIVDGKNTKWSDAVKGGRKDYRSDFAKGALIGVGAVGISQGLNYAFDKKVFG